MASSHSFQINKGKDSANHKPMALLLKWDIYENSRRKYCKNTTAMLLTTYVSISTYALITCSKPLFYNPLKSFMLLLLLLLSVKQLMGCHHFLEVIARKTMHRFKAIAEIIQACAQEFISNDR